MPRPKTSQRLLALLMATVAGASAQSTRLLPENLIYQGAFRLPENTTSDDLKAWNYGGSALAFYPDGDPSGAADGYPGSLFGVGHPYGMQVSEISIPAPKKLNGSNADALPVAKTLQGFQNITGGVLPAGSEVRVSGLEYLPKQTGQAQGGLYFSMGHHWMNFDPEGDTQPTHWHAELNLTQAKPQGPWALANQNAFRTSGYIFEIDSAWAAVNTPGKRLAAGGFREHLGGSYGPSLYAFGPWNQSNLPPKSDLANTTLFEYGLPPDSMVQNKHADLWEGGAWLAVGGKSAVVLMGTKGNGPQWYGIPDGGTKGWNAQPYAGCMAFFDPADLAKVVKGQLKPFKVQPYAYLDIDGLLLHPGQRNVGGAAYDRAHGLLYVAEADGSRPLVHVWRVSATEIGIRFGRAADAKEPISMLPLPGKSGIRIVVAGGVGRGPLVLDVLNIRGGRLSRTRAWLGDAATTIDLHGEDLPPGGMFLRAQGGNLDRMGRLPILP
ncbi:MAG: hypothetical protein JWP91_1630 [Fibrobacteres bacterium]|nr:hypothetical protein [Fibrobacterota bacterium]